jgi:hypothetical protein
MLAGFFILRPASHLAKATRARKLKVAPSTISDDEVFGLTAIYAVLVYVIGWWFLEVTGLLAFLSKNLS